MTSSLHGRLATAQHGLNALCELLMVLRLDPAPAGADVPARAEILLSQAHRPISALPATAGVGTGAGAAPPSDMDDKAAMTALVKRAQAGEAEAFGQLYDRYAAGVYRFCYHRTTSVALAEDLTSETFFRALRGIHSFRWQGRDFGAWLTTIARNLVADHYKSSRARLETPSDALPERRDQAPGPEDAVLTRLTHAVLARALEALPDEQRDCLVMRFLQGLSIAETAEVLGRSEGAVKQLQLRAVRSLARALPSDLP